MIQAEKELDGLKSLIRYHCLTPEIYNSMNIATTSNPWIDSNNCNGNIIPCWGVPFSNDIIQKHYAVFI